MGERVLGIGLDLVEVQRIADSLEKHGERFLKRVFTQEEVAYAMGNKTPAVHLAARFAAKEAVSKAFGTGIGKYLGWTDVEVCRFPHGEPFVRMHGKGEQLCVERGVRRVLVTLTHTKSHAAANSVLIGL